jgi:hypothetical protein
MVVLDLCSSSLLTFPATATGNVAPSSVIAGSSTMIPSSYAQSSAMNALDRNGNSWVVGSALQPLPDGGFVVGAGQVTSFSAGAQGNVAPNVNITGSNTQIAVPAGVAVDPLTGNIYVTNDVNPVVSSGAVAGVLVYPAGANGNAGPSTVLTQVSTPQGIWVDGTGKIFVADKLSILVFAAGSTGAATPAAVITGALNTQLSVPYGITTDANGNIWVTDISNQSIDEFAPTANGDVAPLRMIVGPAAKLSQPAGIAVDNAGYIYETNFASGGYVNVFAPGAKGDAAPVQTLAGPNTMLQCPIGVAVL